MKVDADGYVTRVRVDLLGRVDQKTKGDLTRWFHNALPDADQYQGVGYKSRRDAADALVRAVDAQLALEVPDTTDELTTVG